MTERRQFPYSDPDVEIILHPDGTLTIDMDAEYGDSEVGFGVTSKTATLDAAQVAIFRQFLEEARRDDLPG